MPTPHDDWLSQNRAKLDEAGISVGSAVDFLDRNRGHEGQGYDYDRVFSALNEPGGSAGPSDFTGGGPNAPSWNMRGVPRPNLPAYEKPPAFNYDAYTSQYTPSTWRAPSIDQVLADPSYQWRKQQGEDSLQRWAAARGTLNASDTATGLIDYGQKAASQEYGNVYNRERDIYQTNEQQAQQAESLRQNQYLMNRGGALATYNTNYGTQYVDPYRFEYQRQSDLFSPQMAEWQTEADFNSASQLQTQQLSYADSWNRHLADLEDKRWGREFEWRVTSED